MRVALVIATLTYGGTQSQLFALASELARRGSDVLVCCLTLDGPIGRDLRRLGIDVRVMRKRHRFDIYVLWKLVRELRQFQPDIVHCFLFTSNVWGRLAGALTGVPVVLASVRSLDARRGFLPVVIDRMLIRLTDRIICNAQAIADHLAKREGIPPSRLVVVRNGIDLDRFDGRLRTEEGPVENRCREHPVVGMVCRIDPRKGIEVFLDSCEVLLRRHENLRFLLVGDAKPHRRDELAYRAGIVERLTRPPLASAGRLLGYTADVPASLACMDVFVLTSWTEGCPNALMEAMAMARPVVATAVGGVPELIRPGVDGILVAPGDVQGVADGVLRLLNDPPAARAMGREAQERIRREFSLARMVAETCGVYEECLRGWRVR
jgi:glycosyltransferase involved in cell wall biosynthesis